MVSKALILSYHPKYPFSSLLFQCHSSIVQPPKVLGQLALSRVIGQAIALRSQTVSGQKKVIAMSVQIEQPIVYVGDRVKILKTKGSKKWIGCTALVIEVADGGQTIHAEIEGQSGLRLIFDPTWLELVPLEESKDSNPSLEQQPTTVKPQKNTPSSQQSTPSEEPYEFSKCTITVGIRTGGLIYLGDSSILAENSPPVLPLKYVALYGLLNSFSMIPVSHAIPYNSYRSKLCR